MGLTQFSAPGFTRPKSRCLQSCAFFFWRFWGESISRLIQVAGRIHFQVVIEARSLFPCWLLARSHSQFPEATHISCLVVPSIFTPAEPMHDIYLCRHGQFDHERNGNDGDGCRKKLIGVYLVIKILLFWTHPLVSIHMGPKVSTSVLTIQRSLSMHFSPKFLCHQFPNCDPFKSLNNQSNHWTWPMNKTYSCTSGYFSFQAKWTHWYIFWSYAHWKDVFPPPSFRDVLERACNATAVHFGIVPAYRAEPSLNQVQVFSSSVKWLCHRCAYVVP